MPKNILFISYDGMADPLGRSQVIPYLAGLSRLGFSISIMSAEKAMVYKNEQADIENILEAEGIKWFPVAFSNRIPGWSAWKNYIRLKKKAERIFNQLHIDIVHCRSYIPALLGLHLKAKFGCKMIFDMRGFWADERVEGNLWPQNNPLYKATFQYFKKKEIDFLEGSDAIVTLTNNAKKEILSWTDLKIADDKISVIPCCADLNFFSKKNIDLQKQSAAARDLGIERGDFILSYSGSVGTWYMLNEMLLFFKVLLLKKSNAKFLFITQEPRENILRLSSQLQIPADKILTEKAGRSQMPLLLSLSHVSIFFIKNSFSKKASSPTKMGELMSLGIPLICNSGVGDVEEIITNANAGIALNDFSIETFEKCVEQIDELSNISKEIIRAGAIEFFDLEKGIATYQRIYTNL